MRTRRMTWCATHDQPMCATYKGLPRCAVILVQYENSPGPGGPTCDPVVGNFVPDGVVEVGCYCHGNFDAHKEEDE